jgi:hypothetical protein
MPIETEEKQVETPADEGGVPASSVHEEHAPVDTKALEATVDSLLGKAFSDSSQETAEPPAEEQPTDEQIAAGEKPAGEEEVTAEEEQDAQGAAAKPQPVTVTPADGNAPTLPAAFRRSLIARGYTETEIDADLKTQGTRFVEMAERVHRGRSAEIADWANAGRQAKAAQQQQQQQRQQQQQPTVSDGALPKLDAKVLKEQFGDDKLIDALVGPVNAAIDRLNAKLPVIENVQKRSETAEQEALIRHIDGFFSGKELAPYKAVYGDTAGFAKDQKFIDARNKVLETADALIAGAGLQGRSLTLGEALTLAHDALSGDYKLQAVRTQVKQALTQRTNGITLKPGTRVASNPAGYNGSKATTERKIGALLTKAFA